MFTLLFYITYFTNIAFFFTSVILSYLFFKKYIGYGKLELLYFGLAVLSAGITLAGFTLFWDTIKLFTSYEVPFIIYFLVFGLYPLAAVFFIKSISTLILKTRKNQQIIMAFTVLLSLALIITYFILFFLDTDNIGYIGENEITIVTNFINIIFTPLASLIVLIGALVFVYKALKTKAPVSQLKGKFILVGALLLLISALAGIFEAIGVPREIIQLINAGTRVFGFIFLYIGFALPESVKKAFLK